MPYIKYTEQDKQSAYAASIVDYLISQGEKVKKVGREHVWEAPSGKVSINGSEWYSQYERVGGNAVGFLQHFFGLSYPQAVGALIGKDNAVPMTTERKEQKTCAKKEFVLPQANENNRRAFAYLTKDRKIDKDIVAHFVSEGLIFEDTKYHNAVFVGINKEGQAVHAHKRATASGSDYKGNVEGSAAEYSFHFKGTSENLYVFEAPIDMLAYISMNKNGWKDHSYVALCSTADRAVMQMLKDDPNLNTVYLCLDNDTAGQLGCERIAEAIHAYGDQTVWRIIPENKDWDEDLMARHGLCSTTHEMTM